MKLFHASGVMAVYLSWLVSFLYQSDPTYVGHGYATEMLDTSATYLLASGDVTFPISTWIITRIWKNYDLPNGDGDLQ